MTCQMPRSWGWRGRAAKSRDEHRPFVRRTILIVGWVSSDRVGTKCCFMRKAAAENTMRLVNQLRTHLGLGQKFEAITSSTRAKNTPALTGRGHHHGECPIRRALLFPSLRSPFPTLFFFCFSFFVNKTTNPSSFSRCNPHPTDFLHRAGRSSVSQDP
jgi:hypothetical protein